MGRAETGQRGEAAAARFYQKQGAELLGHNYHTRMGEIDLILREPDGTLVFCEVKTRAKDSLDTPAAAVNAAKQRRIIACAAVSYTHLMWRTLPRRTRNEAPDRRGDLCAALRL